MRKTTHLLLIIGILTVWGSWVRGESPDYGNSYDTAENLPTDGTILEGEITADDQDWFTFTPAGFSSYRVRFSNQDSNWKTIRFYQENEFGDLVEFYNFSVYAQAGLRTFYLEYDYPCYIKVDQGGGYNVMVEYLSSTTADLYSNTCGQGDSLTIDAPAITGTLDHNDPENFDNDWFVIDTEPFHMYQITLTTVDNSWAAFRVYPENCGNAIQWDTRNYTLTSWYGEPYQINVIGDQNRLGCIYTIEAIDLGPVTDDHGNTFDQGTTVPTDNSEIAGVINYISNQQSDVDWFTFETPGNGLYQVDFFNPDSNWKTITVYQIDTFGELKQSQYWSAYNGNGRQTVFLEAARTCYIQVSGSTGDYSFMVDELGVVADDMYGDDCSEASALTVDAEASIGTLNHIDADTFDLDWFSFETEALHMYQIVLTHANNSWARFRVYTGDCATNIAWDSYDYTVTSWDGESYRLNVIGDSNRLGNYYTLQVIDLGLFPDDYGNRYADSNPLPLDGTELTGKIDYNSNYHSDQDWLNFEVEANTKMTWLFKNGETNWKTIHIYKINQFGDLEQTIQWSVYNDIGSRTILLENAGAYTAQVEGSGGDYSIIVDNVELITNDPYSDSCEDGTEIQLDTPTIGTLDHKAGGVDTDWFVMHTEALHSYHLQLSYLDNSNIRFRVYRADCSNDILWNNATDITLTSWSGEDYSIAVVVYGETQGQYYTLTITDLGINPDDYPNTAASSVEMPKDGTLVEGIIDYASTLGSDEDWFHFVGGLEGDYQFKLHNPESNWKTVRLYLENEYGQLNEVKNFSVYGNESAPSWHLNAGKYYILVHGGTGSYGISLISPDPRCGDLDHPYPAGDASHDCIVDINDLAIMAAHWMEDNNPVE